MAEFAIEKHLPDIKNFESHKKKIKPTWNINGWLSQLLPYMEYHWDIPHRVMPLPVLRAFCFIGVLWTAN